jgi:hypothetical protein
MNRLSSCHYWGYDDLGLFARGRIVRDRHRRLFSAKTISSLLYQAANRVKAARFGSHCGKRAHFSKYPHRAGISRALGATDTACLFSAALQHRIAIGAAFATVTLIWQREEHAMAKLLSAKSILIRDAIKANPNKGNKEIAELLNDAPERRGDKI